MYAKVIVDIAHQGVDRVFDYCVPDGMEIEAGMRVLVPFGGQTKEGIVMALDEKSEYDDAKIKDIIKPLEPFAAVTRGQLALTDYIVQTYNTTVASALRLMIPAQLRGGKVSAKKQQHIFLAVTGEAFKEAEASLYKKDGTIKYEKQLDILRQLEYAPDGLPASGFSSSSVEALIKKGIITKEQKEIGRLPFKKNVALIDDFELTETQKEILEKIEKSGKKKFLLHGVTGSGKTEIYIRVMRKCLEEGKTAIMLVPEISLTAQTYLFLKRRFKEEIAVFHSGLSAGERFDEWMKVKRGQAKIVLGARSAVFAPLENIGAIIIDEEHESSYKADNYPKYTAHEMAEKRCEIEGAMLILGSATPKIETYYSAQLGEYVLLKMEKRLFDLPLPEVEIVDMRAEMQKGNRTAISGSLYEELAATLYQQKQAMLFINRRGYSTFVMCRGCGHVIKCDSCDVTMTYHKAQDILKCHYCGKVKAPQKICPECGKPYLKYFGTGTQQIEEQLKAFFPSARVLRMDLDTMGAKDAHTKVFEQFRDREADILLGTQMITKGFDFEGVRLSGILAADTMLNFPDYRSAERTFSQITQVAGRAGRKERGKVVLQTYNPEHYAVACAAKHDYDGFYEKEIAYRRIAKLPPFSVFVQVQFSGGKEEQVVGAVRDFIRKLKGVLLPLKSGIISIRAAQSAIKRISDKQRYHVLIHIRKGMQDVVIKEIYGLFKEARYADVLLGMDINPDNMA